MRVEYLYYFLVVSETKSLNKAANKLFISQQQLSRIVSSLENEFQTQLLNRTSGGVSLTKDGEEFTKYAIDIVNKAREMHAYFYLNHQLPVNETPTAQKDSCNLVLPFFFSLFLTDLIGSFHKQYPNISLRCSEHENLFSAENFNKSEALFLIIDEFGRLDELKAETDCKYYHIGDSAACYCVSADSELNKQTSLNLEDFPEQRITVYPYITDRYANLPVQYSDKVFFISSNINQHLESVVHNHTICPVPSFTRNAILAKYPQINLVQTSPASKLLLYILHSNQHTLSAAEISVIHFLSSYLQKLTAL